MSIFERRNKLSIGGLFICTWLFISGIAAADERILNYQSDIMVNTDGTLIVTETLRVHAEGINIRKGIFRDFPTRYKDRLGNYYQVGFDVLGVQRDGIEETFQVDAIDNGVRVKIGNPNRTLSHGIHSYRIRFQTTRQLGFFTDHDELYWNVTGNGWAFPIDQVVARIELPSPVQESDLRTDLYTGQQGEIGSNGTSRVINEYSAEFQTTRSLRPYEGMTVVLGWPKGIVKEPTTAERARYFLQDNGSALVLIMGLLAPLTWYLWAWKHYGRDPEKGIIIPLFKAPPGLSPAGCSYIRKMSFGKQAFTAAIVSLGVKGYLEIHEEDDEFTLRLKPTPVNGRASKGERGLMTELFKENTEVTLKQENHQRFTRARSALHKALKAEHVGRVFNLNTYYALPAAGMTILAAIIAAPLHGGPLVWVLFAAMSVTLHIAFVVLMRAPTPAGRQIMDQIEGLKMYLDTAEQDRLDRMRSPQLTPEVFEAFLPYAFALGVENNWCTRFGSEFPQDAADNTTAYHPGWYSGRYNGITGLHHLGNSFNSSFSSAISSASTPPGSSSGSGGGGFSGGGGGGGGGGGW